MKIISITLLLIGCVIGAGFATGAEIVTFFGQLALPTWLIAIIVSLTMFTIIALTICLEPILTTNVHTWWTVTMIGLYLIVFTTMTAGVTQIIGTFASIVSLLLSAVIVLFGIDKLQRINNLIVMTIIIVLLTICVPHVKTSAVVNFNFSHLSFGTVNGFLYAGLNCLMFPELINAVAKHHRKRDLYWAGLLTAFIVGILVFLILHTIRVTGTKYEAIPLLATAQHPITSVMILLAILTSQYSALYAIIKKTTSLPGRAIPKYYLVAIFCTVALIGSFFGFNQILGVGYRIIGIVICFSLLISWLRTLPTASRHH